MAIPLVIAATGFALTDSPEAPKAPPRAELDSALPRAGTRPARTYVE